MKQFTYRLSKFFLSLLVLLLTIGTPLAINVHMASAQSTEDTETLSSSEETPEEVIETSLDTSEEDLLTASASEEETSSTEADSLPTEEVTATPSDTPSSEVETQKSEEKVEVTTISDTPSEDSLKTTENLEEEEMTTTITQSKKKQKEQLPDLVIKKLVSITAPESNGGNYHIEFKVKNAGKGDISENDYRDVQAIIKDSAGNTKVNTTWENPFNLAKGETKIQNGFFRSEEPIQKGDSITLTLDKKNEITESNESNNTKTFPIQKVIGEIQAKELLPDLVLEDIRMVNKNPREADWITFEIKIKNAGDVPTGNFGLKFNGSTAGYSSLEPGKYKKFGGSNWFSLGGFKANPNNSNYLGNGKYIFTVILDPLNSIKEQDETNNEKTITITVEIPEPEETKKADLEVSSLDLVRNDDWVEIRYCITNNGEIPSGKFYVQEKNLNNPKWNFGGQGYTNLNPGETRCQRSSRSGVTDKGGNGYVKGENEIEVIVDFKEQVNESDETNNNKKSIITIEEEKTPTEPDLVITSFDLNTNGRAVEYEVCVKNIGEQKTEQHLSVKLENLVNSYWRFDGHGYTKMEPGRNYCRKSLISNVINDSAKGYIAGSNPIKVTVDYENTIQESNENNNSLVKEIILPEHPTFDKTPRIALWWGKVNQHIENSIWKTDSDGVSGAEKDKLEYCQKWYPNTVSVEPYKTEMINWYDQGNTQNTWAQWMYNKEVQSYKCVQEDINSSPSSKLSDLLVNSVSIRNRNEENPSAYFCIRNNGENDSGFFDTTITLNGKTDYTQTYRFSNLKASQDYCREKALDTAMLSQGVNSIVVTVDPQNMVTELNEKNNTRKEFFIGNNTWTSQSTCNKEWTGYVYNSQTNTCVKQSATGCSNPFEYSNYFSCRAYNIFSKSDSDNLIAYDDDNNYEDEVLTAEFEEEVITNMYFFSDTTKTSLEGKASAYLRTLGIIGGFPDGEFKGDREVNRAELSKFLLLGAKNVPPSVFKNLEIGNLQNNGRFPDVLDGEWYVKYVMKAEDLGIVSGYPDGLFRPAHTVNTAEFLKMLAKTYGLDTNLPYDYQDVNSADWFAKYAGIAQRFNLFPDRNPDYLDPAQELTRREVAIALYRYFRERNVASDNLARRYVTAEQYLNCIRTKSASACTGFKKFYNSNSSTWNTNYTQNQYTNDGLVVSNNMSNQENITVSDDETNVQALSLKFSTEGKSAKISGLKFRRIGNGSWSDFESAWITVSNRNQPVSNKIIITDDIIEIPFNETIELSENDAKYFILNVDMSGSGESGNDSRFVLYLPEWIKSTTEVVGFFPFGGYDIEIE